MHKRQWILIYLLLGTVAGLLSWKLAADWKTGNMRYANASRSRGESPLILPASLSQAASPASDTFVARNLFVVDRNNQIVVEEEKLKPAPPVPIVFGTMNLGGKYEALMAEGGQPGRPAFRRVKDGEHIGDYSVIEIGDEKVVVEFRGEKKTINVYQSANSVPRPEVRSGTPASPVVESVAAPQQQQQASQPTSAQASSSGSATPGIVVPSNDPYTKITIEGNRRKIERQTPFGTQVGYEDIK